MKPFFCRVGNKTPILDKILELFPEHKTYVEPFVGSGAVLFAKPLSDIEIINDLDKSVVENFKLLKKANINIEDYNIPNDNIKSIQNFVNLKTNDINDKILQKLYISCNTFGNLGVGKIYKQYDGKRKINKISEYKNRLKKVKIYNTDYKKIINNYDDNDTLFFLDPPYEKSKGLYKEHNFDYEELNNILKNIKGLFILTLNDSRNIRKIFKNFNIKRINVKGGSNNNSPLGSGIRKEVIITNYHF